MSRPVSVLFLCSNCRESLPYLEEFYAADFRVLVAHSAGDLGLLSRESIDVVVAMRDVQLRACAHCNLRVPVLLLREGGEQRNKLPPGADAVCCVGSSKDLPKALLTVLTNCDV